MLLQAFPMRTLVLGHLCSLAFQKQERKGEKDQSPEIPAQTPSLSPSRAQCSGGKHTSLLGSPVIPSSPQLPTLQGKACLASAHGHDCPSPQLKARCEELKLDWSTLSLESLLKEKQALRTQISEKQRRCLELQVGPRTGTLALLGLGHGVRSIVRVINTPTKAILLTPCCHLWRIARNRADGVCQSPQGISPDFKFKCN